MSKFFSMRTLALIAASVITLAHAIASNKVFAAEAEATISMTMKDADLADVMDMIAREYRLNIFVSTDTTETVSFSIYDMQVRDAIHSIASAAGLAMEYSQGNYYLVDRDEAGKYAPDALTIVRGFELQYVGVSDIAIVLTPYLSEYGEITIVPERNMFLVEDTPAFLRRIATLVDEIDRRPVQILIEAKILEISLTDEDEYGLDWSKFFFSDGESQTFGTRGLGDASGAGIFLDYTTPDFDVALNALTSQGRVRTLSTPQLLALENVESSVIIGDRRGYAVTTTINQVTTETIEFLESGVILRVTASVDTEGQVLMDIHPEVSTGVIDPLTGVPSQTTTEVTTQMIVPDQATIFVGGLIKTRIEESKQGVPVIGRLPLLGRLFSNRQFTNTNTETIVLITPTIVQAGTAPLDAQTADKVLDLELSQQQQSQQLETEMDVFFNSELTDSPAQR